MLSIGEFSKICGVSTKALRHYDEIGLLRPEAVNPENGYRQYAIGQLKAMLFINRLKAYHFSLEEIKALLAEDPGQARLTAALRRKHAEIRRRMDAYADALIHLQNDLTTVEGGIPLMAYFDTIDVQLIQTQPMQIYTIRRVMNVDAFPQILAELFGAVGMRGLTPAGPPMTFYHNPDFNPEASDIEVAVPVREATKDTRALPAMLCAKAVHSGAYDGLTAVYARMRTWIEQEGYALISAPFEIYRTDPHSAETADANVTEVYYPVRKA